MKWEKVVLSILVLSLILFSNIVSATEKNKQVFVKEITFDISTKGVNGTILFRNYPLVQVVKNNEKKFIEGINETFDYQIRDINIVFNESNIFVFFALDKANEDYSFFLNKINSTVRYSEWAILFFDKLTVVIPADYSYCHVSPEPDHLDNNVVEWVGFNWNIEIELTFMSLKNKTRECSTLINRVEKKSISSSVYPNHLVSIQSSSYGNEYSKFLVPDIEAFTGNDIVNGHRAQEWAEKYKPFLIYDVDTPDYLCLSCSETSNISFYYRVLKGEDPFTGYESIAILYYGYWDYQPCPCHNYDYEPIWVWVSEYESPPYKIVFDDWDLNDGMSGNFHIRSAYRTYMHSEYPHGVYNLYDNTSHKAHYPFGKKTFTHKIRLESVSSLSFENNTHVWLRIPHCWHTYSANLDCGLFDNCDEDEIWYCPEWVSSYSDFEPSIISLTDNVLEIWYQRYFNRQCGTRECLAYLIEEPLNYPLTHDVSDPYNSPWWPEISACDSEYPTISIDITNISINSDLLTVDASVTYSVEDSEFYLRGLWADRFIATIGGYPARNPTNMEETSAGHCKLEFDVSDISPGDYTLHLYVYDNLWEEHSVDTIAVTIPVIPTTTTSTTTTSSTTTTMDAYPPNEYTFNPASGSTITTTSPYITFDTNENAWCRWGLTDVGYTSMANDCNVGEGTTTHGCSVSGLSFLAGQEVYVSCRDSVPNYDTGSTNANLVYHVNPGSLQKSNFNPSTGSTLTSSSFTLTLNTNVDAFCRWSLSDIHYDQMSGNCDEDDSFDTYHVCNIWGLPEGYPTWLYVGCMNAWDTDTSETNEDLHYYYPPTTSTTTTTTSTTSTTTTSTTTTIITLPTHLTVCSSGCDYTKIQDAIDSANSGDTILVEDGTYTENVKVNKSLTIESENGADKTVVQTANSDDHVFEVTADYVNIIGFKITGAGVHDWNTGIHLVYVNYCKILDNIVSENPKGIRIHSSSNNIIVNNSVSKNWDVGIHLAYSSNNTITNNNISDNGDGIELLYSSDKNIITNNNISDNGDGIYVYDLSNNNIISNNYVTSNYDYGIKLSDHSTSNVIDNNEVIDNKQGILLVDSPNNNLSSNNISSNEAYGIELLSSPSTVNKNRIVNNRYGILLFSSGNSIISNNTFVNDGIDSIDAVDDSYPNTVENNTVNGKPLVYLENVSDYRIVDAGQVILIKCSNITVENLNLSYMGTAIKLHETKNIRIRNNTIDSNRIYGVLLQHSINSTINNNNIVNNEYGIRADFPSYCIQIYLNNFINNNKNVYFEHPPGILNSNETIVYTYNGNTYTNYLGNYWDDHADIDTDGDGIWDTPYINDPYFVQEDKDYYPLVEPSENYFVPLPTTSTPGDINGDDHVNVFDLALMGQAWGTSTGDSDYNEDADLNGDGTINVFDLAILGQTWGS